MDAHQQAFYIKSKSDHIHSINKKAVEWIFINITLMPDLYQTTYSLSNGKVAK